MLYTNVCPPQTVFASLDTIILLQNIYLLRVVDIFLLVVPAEIWVEAGGRLPVPVRLHKSYLVTVANFVGYRFLVEELAATGDRLPADKFHQFSLNLKRCVKEKNTSADNQMQCVV
jgi:hypothetical protein